MDNQTKAGELRPLRINIPQADRRPGEQIRIGVAAGGVVAPVHVCAIS